MSDLTAVRGTLRKGDPCWTLVLDGGDKLFLVGDLSNVHDGEVVMATGQLTEQSFCGAAPTLIVTWIGTKVGGGALVPKAVVRDVMVKVTRSSSDVSPWFRLEGKPMGLSAHGENWVGNFPGVAVSGKLDVYYESNAWKDQKFTLAVEATDPASGKVTKSSWPPVVEEKGYVVIRNALDVGAAE